MGRDEETSSIHTTIGVRSDEDVGTSRSLSAIVAALSALVRHSKRSRAQLTHSVLCGLLLEHHEKCWKNADEFLLGSGHGQEPAASFWERDAEDETDDKKVHVSTFAKSSSTSSTNVLRKTAPEAFSFERIHGYKKGNFANLRAWLLEDASLEARPHEDHVRAKDDRGAAAGAVSQRSEKRIDPPRVVTFSYGLVLQDLAPREFQVKYRGEQYVQLAETNFFTRIAADLQTAFGSFALEDVDSTSITNPPAFVNILDFAAPIAVKRQQLASGVPIATSDDIYQCSLFQELITQILAPRGRADGFSVKIIDAQLDPEAVRAVFAQLVELQERFGQRRLRSDGSANASAPSAPFVHSCPALLGAVLGLLLPHIEQALLHNVDPDEVQNLHVAEFDNSSGADGNKLKLQNEVLQKVLSDHLRQTLEIERQAVLRLKVVQSVGKQLFPQAFATTRDGFELTPKKQRTRREAEDAYEFEKEQQSLDIYNFDFAGEVEKNATTSDALAFFTTLRGHVSRELLAVRRGFVFPRLSLIFKTLALLAILANNREHSRSANVQDHDAQADIPRPRTERGATHSHACLDDLLAAEVSTSSESAATCIEDIVATESSQQLRALAVPSTTRTSNSNCLLHALQARNVSESLARDADIVRAGFFSDLPCLLVPENHLEHTHTETDNLAAKLIRNKQATFGLHYFVEHLTQHHFVDSDRLAAKAMHQVEFVNENFDFNVKGSAGVKSSTAFLNEQAVWNTKTESQRLHVFLPRYVHLLDITHTPSAHLAVYVDETGDKKAGAIKNSDSPSSHKTLALKHYVAKGAVSAPDFFDSLARATTPDTKYNKRHSSRTNSSSQTMQTTAPAVTKSIRIPKRLLQIGPIKESMRVTYPTRRHLPADWEFRSFGDEDCENFMRANPIDGFPRAIEYFRKKFIRGAHRGDFCVLFVLYQLGGVSIDSDVLLFHNIESLVADADFVGIDRFEKIDYGILGVRPKDIAIRKTLQDMYMISRDFFTDLDFHYLAPCSMLYHYVQRYYLAPQWGGRGVTRFAPGNNTAEDDKEQTFRVVLHKAEEVYA
ncbi:unnamed protein product [Amoebophrya sp. A120]|nr:unnamed protein product [Amoebophrya sp. A120]|eukprot:GSA120T00005285001.1